ncbi:YiiX/YebB-like N1pC/P60 family cysteine hydrolase [Sporosarcina sp.]|uniref:YiiX/YebB-like N1pC/P60 family cysteine hydrolase n=1 Tax=Sporosarcina sp. TaxID=49982 RepID=UPI00262C939D|nr:YiiX/YebB-like N1pC/P60 family cysteine hydrolase [Sporosarcina sp.]
MRKKKWLQKGSAGLIAIMMVTGGAFPLSASANEDLKSKKKLSTIVSVNRELSIDEVNLLVQEYALSEGITESESLDSFYEEALVQQIEQKHNNLPSSEEDEYSVQSVTNANQAPGVSRYKGDVMYSKAWTGVNHGHSAIYYTKSTVVHAPGISSKSRAESANNKIGLKNGIQIQYVDTTQTNRNKAADYAYTNFRNKPYDKSFASNKKTTTKLNCSGLVWNAYIKTAKVDLDGNGGPGVYPSNIRDSSKTVTYAYK